MSEARESLHGQWSSRWAFILATTGAAVGLGNIWKFPYIAGENGGGAFVLVYLICIALLGVPIMMAEVTLGRHGRRNPAGSMKSLALESGRSKHWQWVGGIGILASFLVLSYYSVIAGWAVDYVIKSAQGLFTNASTQQIDTMFTQLTSNPWKLILWHTCVITATVGVVVFGVEKGLERAVKYMFPVMLALMLIIVGYSMQSGFFGHGLRFLFEPNFDKLTGNGMLIALGHAFFTLSLATGSIMMYGAYVPKNVSIPRAAFAIAAADTLIALVAGLAIFPIVFANGLEPGAGPGLIFKTLPIAFGKMPYGTVFATIFFIMLVFAAFTSAISLLEPSVAWLMERFNLSRVKSTFIAGFGIWFVGLGTVFSFNIWHDVTFFGKNIFDLFDYLTANLMLPLGGLGIAVFTAWFIKKEIVLKEMCDGNHRVYTFWRYVLGIVAPAAVILVFLKFLGIC